MQKHDSSQSTDSKQLCVLSSPRDVDNNHCFPKSSEDMAEDGVERRQEPGMRRDTVKCCPF